MTRSEAPRVEATEERRSAVRHALGELSFPAACAAARAGHLEAARVVFDEHAARGEPGAHVALAVLHAYEGAWPRAVQHIASFLAAPGSLEGTRLVDEVKWLLLRAGHEGDVWTDVGRALRGAAPRKWGQPSELDRFLPIQVQAAGGLEDLRLHRRAELGLAVAVRRRRLDETMERLIIDTKGRPRPLSSDEHALARFERAIELGLDEDALGLLGVVATHGGWPLAVHAARLLVRHGRADEAWKLLLAKRRHFVPCDDALFVPIEPLVDDVLRTLLTPERRRAFLGA